MRCHYRFDESAIRFALTAISRLRSVQIEDAASVTTAIELTSHGAEFEDAMHLAGRPDGVEFVYCPHLSHIA